LHKGKYNEFTGIQLSHLNIGGNGKLYAPCGVFGDAFSSPVTNFAKTNQLRRWKYARMAYDSLLGNVFY